MIMILLFYILSPFAQWAADWRSGPRWSILSVLCPVHPFPLRGTSPQGETRDMREKTASHILQVPFRRFPPLVAGATTLPGGKHVTGFAGRLQLPYESSSFATPASGGTIKSSVMLRGAYESTAFQSFILSPGWGKVRRSRIGGVICRRQIIQQNGYFVI